MLGEIAFWVLLAILAAALSRALVRWLMTGRYW